MSAQRADQRPLGKGRPTSVFKLVRLTSDDYAVPKGSLGTIRDQVGTEASNPPQPLWHVDWAWNYDEDKPEAPGMSGSVPVRESDLELIGEISTPAPAPICPLCKDTHYVVVRRVEGHTVVASEVPCPNCQKLKGGDNHAHDELIRTIERCIAAAEERSIGDSYYRVMTPQELQLALNQYKAGP